MIQAIVQNNRTDSSAIAELPQSRMNLAGMLASIGIQKSAYDIPCKDNEEDKIQVKFIGSDRFGAQIVSAIRETDTLSSVNAVCDMYCSLPYQSQQKLRGDIEENGVPSLKVFAERMGELLRQDYTVSYYCPLKVSLYERDYWGDLSEDPVDIEGTYLPGYEPEIRQKLAEEQEDDDMAQY